VGVKEKWRSVTGYDGAYEVSSEGRCRSLDRIDSAGHKRRGAQMSVCQDARGYKSVILCREGVRKYYGVHVLVAMAFCPGRRGKQNQVNHIDGIKWNNTPPNLEWCTPEHNVRHAHRTGLVPRGGSVGLGSRNINSKLNEHKVREIKLLLKTMSHQKISEIYGVTRCCITQISLGNNWGHVTANK